MNYNRNSNMALVRGSGSYAPRTAGSRVQSAVPNNAMSSTRIYGGNRVSNTNMSSPNTYSGQQQQYLYQQQMQMAGPRGRQEVGRRTSRPNTSLAGRMSVQGIPQQVQTQDWQNTNMRSMLPSRTMQPQRQSNQMPVITNRVQPQTQMTQGQGQGPTPINVNVTAAMLASANNKPAFADRVETGLEGNPNVKYIPLSWDAILGKTGMNGMKISMAPPAGSDADSQNQNRQLKISFGEQGVVSQEGETPLRVVSFEPLSSGRMDGSSGQGFNPNQSPMNFSLGPGGQPGQNLYMDKIPQQQGQAGQGQGGRGCNCPNCRR